MANIYGNGLIGRVDVNWVQTSGFYWDENHNKVFYTNTERRDDRSYYIKDHLGSNRLTINSLRVITNAQDYYPGVYPAASGSEVLRSYNNSSPNEKYKFTGKERDTETNLDYFGARFYDSELGRWTSVDPLASKYSAWSPYNYCMDNPFRYIDPNGMEDVPWTAEDLSESLQNGADGFSAVKRGYRAGKSNPNQAALAAANAYGKTNWQNQKHEWGCYIVLDISNNNYGYTNFTEGRTESNGKEIWKSEREVTQDRFNFKVAGLIVVGFWHQHIGPSPYDDSFSWGDMNTGYLNSLDVYGTFPNGNVEHFNYRKYSPDIDPYQSAREATEILYSNPCKFEIKLPQEMK